MRDQEKGEGSGGRGKIHTAERLGEVGGGRRKGGKSLYRVPSMILAAGPDQRISKEITENVSNVLHLVNTFNKDHCILFKGFQDYKEAPTPESLCMCICRFMCVSAHTWINIQRPEVSQCWCLPSVVST